MKLSGSIRLAPSDNSSSMLFNSSNLRDLLGSNQKPMPGMKKGKRTKKKNTANNNNNNNRRPSNASVGSNMSMMDKASAEDLIKEILMQETGIEAKRQKKLAKQEKKRIVLNVL